MGTSVQWQDRHMVLSAAQPWGTAVKCSIALRVGMYRQIDVSVTGALRQTRGVVRADLKGFYDDTYLEKLCGWAEYDCCQTPHDVERIPKV